MTVAEARGLLVDGRYVQIAGLTILGPGDAPWVRLEARDYKRRPTGVWPTQIFGHSTWGGWPHKLVPGAGPFGGSKRTAEYWHTSPEGKRQSGGAHIIVDEAPRTLVCLVDIARMAAHHATRANPWSVGIEMHQRTDGRIYESVLETTTLLIVALCTGAGATYVDDGSPWPGLGIPLQIPGHRYVNTIIERLKYGDPTACGVFGHRDCAWKFPSEILDDRVRARYPNGYADRGRGDPGDEFYERLKAAGAETLDFDARQDIVVWKPRQARLNELGERLVVDGIAARKTNAAMRRRGFSHGRELDV